MLNEGSLILLDDDWMKEEEFIPLTIIHLSGINNQRLPALLQPQVRKCLSKMGAMEILRASIRSEDGVVCTMSLDNTSVDKLAGYIITSGSTKTVIFLGTTPRIID